MARTGRPPSSAGWQNQIPGDIFSDEAVSDLEAEARLLLVGMISQADRAGRGSAKPDELRVKCLRRLPVEDAQVLTMLAEMVKGLLGTKYEFFTYSVDRNPYYVFTRWAEWQPGATVTSKFPDPPILGELPVMDPPGARAAVSRQDLTDETPEGLGQVDGSAAPRWALEQPQLGTSETHEEPTIWNSAEYREYTEICEDAQLPWTNLTAFTQLHNAVKNVAGRQWQILIPVAQEAILNMKDKPPAVRYGLAIIKGLPTNLKTRAQVEEHFRQQREGAPPAGARDQPTPAFASTVFPKSVEDYT
jgi:hypothetical protein